MELPKKRSSIGLRLDFNIDSQYTITFQKGTNLLSSYNLPVTILISDQLQASFFLGLRCPKSRIPPSQVGQQRLAPRRLLDHNRRCFCVLHRANPARAALPHQPQPYTTAVLYPPKRARKVRSVPILGCILIVNQGCNHIPHAHFGNLEGCGSCWTPSCEGSRWRQGNQGLGDWACDDHVFWDEAKIFRRGSEWEFCAGLEVWGLRMCVWE
jgi:hypothetical protein